MLYKLSIFAANGDVADMVTTNKETALAFLRKYDHGGATVELNTISAGEEAYEALGATISVRRVPDTADTRSIRTGMKL